MLNIDLASIEVAAENGGAQLAGETHKIRWPHSAHALYVTINDAHFDGALRPFEVFVNSKNMEHYAWTLALTRMISAVFRRGGDVSFVAEELKAVFDPCGGAWMNGRYVPSLPAAIGAIVERRLARNEASASNSTKADAPLQAMHDQAPTARLNCSRCGALGLVRKEGCDTCPSCGHSKCS